MAAIAARLLQHLQPEKVGFETSKVGDWWWKNKKLMLDSLTPEV